MSPVSPPIGISTSSGYHSQSPVGFEGRYPPRPNPFGNDPIAPRLVSSLAGTSLETSISNNPLAGSHLTNESAM